MTYKGWLIYKKKDALENQSFIDWFINEAKLQNIVLELLYRENFTIGIVNNKRSIIKNNVSIEPPDFAVVRTDEPFLSLHLEELGINVFNSATISQICNNKELTHHHVHNLNIPMVDTIFVDGRQMNDSYKLDYPFVAKLSTGHGGNNVHLIENERDWQNQLPDLTSDTVILQSCNVSFGKDLRVFVVGNEIVGSVLRENKKDFRANFKLGGSAKWYQLNNDELKIINKIINNFEFDMVGIDFLFSNSGKLLFNEIEDVVGSRILSAVGNVNILEKYVSHIKSKLDSRNSGH
ncbi:ATP-grasp domain-containing protein [Virgibacillus sp. DJP39]|uniref:ATP-grasp domain-containing protein n=1 Tax=Virgibacillus sp. DJP39 TaxID=3409790 RepID=UPI003BB6B7FE